MMVWYDMLLSNDDELEEGSAEGKERKQKERKKKTTEMTDRMGIMAKGWWTFFCLTCFIPFLLY